MPIYEYQCQKCGNELEALQKVLHHLGIGSRQPIGRQRRPVEFIVAWRVQRPQRTAQIRCERPAGVCKDLKIRGEISHHAIDAVQRSARHQADEQP